MITATKPQTLTKTASSYRSGGWAVIASGATGLIAIGFLIAFLVIRDKNFDEGIMMLRCHDAGVTLQFILLASVVFGFRKLSQQKSRGMSIATFNAGIGALSFTASFLLLGMFKIVSDGFYMLPQGVFGVWLIIVNWRMKGVISAGLRWFGMVVGLGLALVGSFFAGFAILVDTIILQIPAAPLEEVQKIPTDTTANIILHQILWIGSLMGVLTLPFWTLLIGRKLLRES